MKTSERDDYADQLQAANDRYRLDTDFRLRCRAASKARYHDDPVYRAKTIQRALDRYYSARAEAACAACERGDMCGLTECDKTRAVRKNGRN